MDLLIMDKRDGLIGGAVRVTILQDPLSSFFSLLVSPIAEAFTGTFFMTTICTIFHILGLILLGTSTPASPNSQVYAGIFFLALGKSGHKPLHKFIEYHPLQETIKAKEEREVKHGSTQNRKEQDHLGEIRKYIWSVFQLFISYMAIILLIVFNHKGDNRKCLKIVAYLMIFMYVLFFIGYSKWFSRKQLAAESNQQGKIYRICKAVFWKSDSKYLSCTVEEVKEVKMLSVPMVIFRCLTFVPYTVLLAFANIFFVAQARHLTPFTKSMGNYIITHFLIKSFAKEASKYTCKSVTSFRKLNGNDARSKKKACTITKKTWYGMVLAVICIFTAMVVLVLPQVTAALVPQFFLLGMAEGLVGEGFANFLHDHLPKKWWISEGSISELIVFVGKVLVFIISIFFEDAANPRHLEWWFYTGLVILNFMILIYIFISTKEARREDEKITEEIKTLELSIQQPDSHDSYPEYNKEVCPEDEKTTDQPDSQDSYPENNKVSKKESCVDGGKTHENTSSVYPLETAIQHETKQPDMDTEGSNKIIPPNDTLKPLVNPIDTNVQLAQVGYPNEECAEVEKITKKNTLEIPITKHQSNTLDFYPEDNNGTQLLDQVESHAATASGCVSTKESCVATDPSGGKTHTNTMQDDMDTKGSNNVIPLKRLEPLVNPIDTNVQPAQVEYNLQDFYQENNNGMNLKTEVVIEINE